MSRLAKIGLILETWEDVESWVQTGPWVHGRIQRTSVLKRKFLYENYERIFLILQLDGLIRLLV